MILDELQIFIITYNREKELFNTLENLLSSPVKDCSITILDNSSQENSYNVFNEFCSKFTNLHYIKNNRNLGPAGNILKAMELVDNKWLWILGDDDNYDWSAWDEIKNALESDEYDIVNTCWHDGAKSDDPCVLLNEVGFVPTGIYQTKNITPIVMQNAYYLTLTLNPHSAIATYVLNKGGKIYAPNKKLVIENMRKDYSTISIKNSLLHKDMRDYNVVYATLQIYELIEDKNLRYKCNEIICLGSDFKYSMNFMFECGIDLKRIINLFFMLNFKQTCVLLKVIVKRFLKKIYSKRKTETHRIYNIFGIKLKIIRK